MARSGGLVPATLSLRACLNDTLPVSLQIMSDEVHSVAVEQLETLGLSTYAARTLVALVSLDGATAREIDAVSQVPRTRVYDAADELRDAGLATTEESTPKWFSPVSIATIEQQFTELYLTRIERLVDALGAVSDTDCEG
jgi:sugar-specific transcriptional regulator TrmB